MISLRPIALTSRPSREAMRHRVVPKVIAAAVGLVALGANASAAPSTAGRIVFVSNREGGYYQSGYNQIYIMNADGSHLIHIPTPVSPRDPVFSSDGRKIAFVTVSIVSNQEMGQIYIMDFDGSHLTRLIAFSGYVGSPAFSPDGRRIAFGGGALGGGGQIYVMDVDGSHLTSLTHLPGSAGQPAFGPDGRKIAFAYGGPMPPTPTPDQVQSQIYIMDTSGSHITPLTHLPGFNAWPAFSPDGRQIVFVPAREALCIMDADGSHQTFLPIRGAIYSSKFSPDGRKIVFAYYDTREPQRVVETWQIYIMDTDGSHLTRLTNSKAPVFNGSPAFGP